MYYMLQYNFIKQQEEWESMLDDSAVGEMGRVGLEEAGGTLADLWLHVLRSGGCGGGDGGGGEGVGEGYRPGARRPQTARLNREQTYSRQEKLFCRPLSARAPPHGRPLSSNARKNPPPGRTRW